MSNITLTADQHRGGAGATELHVDSCAAWESASGWLQGNQPSYCVGDCRIGESGTFTVCLEDIGSGNMASAVFSATVRALRAPQALGSQARSLAWIPNEFAHRRAAVAAVRGVPLRRLATRAEAAAASPAPPPAGVDPQQAFDSLKGQQVVLVSDQRQLDVTSLWGADERAVLVFARHMGGCRRRRRLPLPLPAVCGLAGGSSLLLPASRMLWWPGQQGRLSIALTLIVPIASPVGRVLTPT